MRNSIFQALFGKHPENPFPPTRSFLPETEVAFQTGQIAWSDTSVIAKVSGITEPKGRAFSIEVTVFMNGKEKVEVFATFLKGITTADRATTFINECVKLWSYSLRALGGRPDKLSKVDVRFYLEQKFRTVLENDDRVGDNEVYPAEGSGFMTVQEVEGTNRGS